RGLGFVPGLWSRPVASLLWIGTVAAVLLARRWRWRWASLAAGIALAVGWMLLGWRDPRPPLADALQALTLDPPVWLLAGLAWLRTHADPHSAVLAHPDYAGAVAVLGGHRVLRAPGLVEAADDERRLRLERAALSGHPPMALLRRYSLGYVFLAPGQFREYGI